ncbi:hypothetical protein MycrhDRAFT_0023 [Mycolicibacterium rhodesiae JS60]|nr:hypothetical protein MycrhDRAFT_0023 [Mycolicibacterium rhodesiae JS60]
MKKIFAATVGGAAIALLVVFAAAKRRQWLGNRNCHGPWCREP